MCIRDRFQDPMTSLDPTMPIGKQIMEGMLWHYKMPKDAAYKKACLLYTSRAPIGVLFFVASQDLNKAATRSDASKAPVGLYLACGLSLIHI